MRSRILLLVATAGIVTMAGCTSTATGNPAGVGALGSVPPTASTPVTQTTPATPPATVPACTSADVAVTQLPGDSGAAGTIVIAIQVSNSSAGTCTIRGYPTFTLTAHSASISTDIDEPVTLEHGNYAGPVFAAAVSTVKLGPGAGARFLLAYSQIHSDGTGGCDEATKLHLTLPSGTGTAIGVVQIPVCGAPMQVSPYLPAAKVTI